MVGVLLAGSRRTLLGRLTASVSVACLCATVTLTISAPAAARAPDDGVYGRFGGDTDLSLKLGGMFSEERWSGSVGVSAHYYSSVGVMADYSESLVADALHARSFAIGTEMRPLFLPRWVLGLERGPGWLDLTIDSACLGFGAYFADAKTGAEDARRGVWLSLGLGFPILGRAAGPWLELRNVYRFPDPEQPGEPPHNALLLYLSWHQFIQLNPSPP